VLSEKNARTQGERRPSIRVMLHFELIGSPVPERDQRHSRLLRPASDIDDCGVIGARMYDNEKGAIAEVRTIRRRKRCISLNRPLGRIAQGTRIAHMIDAEFLSGIRAGYRYDCAN